MADNGEPNAIWTPDGLRTIGAKTPDRIELKSTVGEWLRQFADVASALGMGLYCSKCKADIIGRNSDSDPVYTVSCGCREFVWKNRDFRAPTRESWH